MRDESNAAQLPVRTGLSADAERQPPSNMQAEQAILGAILLNNSAYHRVSNFLRPEHFVEAVHSRIYAAVERLIEKGETASPVTLKRYFDADAALQERGGSQYLARLVGSTVTIINARDYGRTIYETYKLRQVIELATDLAEGAYACDVDKDVDGLIRQAEEELYRIAEVRENTGGMLPMGGAALAALHRAERAFKSGGKPTGVETGLIDLDRFLGGLMPREMTILAGRPSMGKTALATTIIHAAAKKFAVETAMGEKQRMVGFFSLEMSREEIAARLMADISAVSSEKQRRGDLNQADFDAIIDAQRSLESLPILIDDTPALGIAQVRHRARRLARRHGLGLVIVDHLQKMRQPDRTENRRLEIGELTGGLSALAKELDVPVLVLSQLSRAVEQRDDKRPTLADLRESGDIEQDADVVMFLFREEYYLRRSEPTQRDGEDEDGFARRHAAWSQRCYTASGRAEIHIAKNRNGRDGTVRVHFNAERSRFENAAQGEIN